jgi:hypothetical protein
MHTQGHHYFIKMTVDQRKSILCDIHYLTNMKHFYVHDIFELRAGHIRILRKFIIAATSTDASESIRLSRFCGIIVNLHKKFEVITDQKR